jgi:hypothetical protein
MIIANIKRRQVRALATLEVVLVLGVSIVPATAIMWMGVRACRNYSSLLGSLVGMPYM